MCIDQHYTQPFPIVTMFQRFDSWRIDYTQFMLQLVKKHRTASSANQVVDKTETPIYSFCVSLVWTFGRLVCAFYWNHL